VNRGGSAPPHAIDPCFRKAMPATEISHPLELREYLTRGDIGVGEWFEVTQERINLFAEATEDRQWIHTDPERAARESPFGGAIAHGFLTLSLLTKLVADAVHVNQATMGVNSGFGRVRFVSPVPAGGRIRARVRLAAFEAMSDYVQITYAVTLEREEEARTRRCLTAEWNGRLYFEAQQ
jgi:acyl dehydratase